MALNIAELILLGLLAGWLFKKIKLPELVGMLLLGLIIGPYTLQLFPVDSSIMISAGDLRLIALIVILLRAGLELSKETLNKVGGRAIILAAAPPIFEAASITCLGHIILGLSYLEAAILGVILSAVSPAIIVPLMIKFIEKRKGAGKGIPTMVLSGASMNVVFVIVLFSIVIGIYTGENVNIAWKLVGIPISIITGIITGIIMGICLYKFVDRMKPRTTKIMLIILGLSIMLKKVEVWLYWLPFASLMAVLAIGFIILERREHLAHKISAKLEKLWIFAEIALFVLIGAAVDPKIGLQYLGAGLLVIIVGLIFRSAATYICLIGSELNIKERNFVIISYLPKATVQAAIGAAPLLAMQAAGMSLVPGEIILTIAVLSILITAPIGAIAISIYGENVLETAPSIYHAALDAIRESTEKL